MKKLVVLTLCCSLACTDNNSDQQTQDSSIAEEDTQTQDSGALPTDAADTAPDEVDGGTTRADIEACPALSESDEHKVLFDHRVNSVYSPNGVSFANESTLLLEHASVPDGVLRADGKTWVYYVNGNPGQHAIFVAELNADGSALEPVDCIRIDGKVVGDAVDPDIVLLPDGRYRLFYYLGWFVTKPTDPNA
ncbi:MAG TPA: hypothetical protein EYN66_13110, partial [Myxococcales bacterium]|nr:hypothetical protein [Myxococcales bacterium]